MLRKLIHNFTLPRHPWRKFEFDELSEIYASMSIRSFGFGIIGVFVPIYLFQSGFSLQSVFLFYSLFFIFRPPIAYVSAFVVGRIGPKHAIAISTLLLVVFLSLLLTLDMFGWPLALLAFSFSVTNGLFFVAYNTDISKVKNSKNSGSELSWLYIFEKIGGALGPLFGGLIAGIIAPELSIFFAIVVLLCSLIPLFLSNEPVKLHQKITFKGFDWRAHKRDFISLSALGVENVASLVMWPLLISIIIFNEQTYTKIGIISALALGLSILTSRIFGSIADTKNGLNLLRVGTILNSFLHFIKAFTTSAVVAIPVSFIYESLNLSYRIPLVKGYLDATDSQEGYRIVYVTIEEISCAVAKAVYCLMLFVACYFADSIVVLRFSFIIVGIVSLAMLLQRFPSLKKV